MSPAREKRNLEFSTAHWQLTEFKKRAKILLRNMLLFDPKMRRTVLLELATSNARISCRAKIKYTPEDAGFAIATRQSNVNLYLCRSCEYFHFGHNSKLIDAIEFELRNIA